MRRPGGGRGVRTGERGAPASEAEQTALRAAVLLRGGVPASRVFPLLAKEWAEGSAERGIADRVAEGTDAVEALAAAGGPEWRILAVAWDIAERTGAPLAPALERVGAAFTALTELRARRSVLLSAPRATVRLVAGLPLLAILMGALLGFDPLGVLLTPGGAVLLALGGLLLLLGVLWARRLTREVEREDRVVGLELELMWIALGGGAPPGAALRQLADSADRVRAEWVRFDELCAEGRVRSVLRVAEEVGAPLGPMLLEEADAERLREQSELERSAERLGVRVLIPLGVCVLPSFVALGVLPVLFSMLGGLSLG
ncbi:type II secretion system F family protein [Leucobacter sp. CSA1]|uniref:Type II secretion system F family protein n=1 Tax=Leucobacter chromiisoli TaxID=2796471 RepID=A0A934UW71_9MICO|nr:type II secretion system F family protein [Leucobacter chromiisoli]MBK0420231.1 type II secretion system F family protein [Leucobacter chromiisoli]